MTSQRKIINDSFLFTAASQVNQIITAVTGIVSRHLLGPVQMGMYSTLQIVLQYSSYTSLGTSQGISREFPYLIGKGEREKAEKLKNAIATFQIIVGVLTGGFVLVYAIANKNKLPGPIYYGLIMTVVLIVLQRANGLYISIVRASKKFRLASMQMIASACVNLGLVAVLTFFFQLQGFLVALAFSFIFNILFIRFHERISLKICFDVRTVLDVIGFGLPLMFISVLEGLYKSIDKIFIIKFLGFEAMGWYSIAILVSNFAQQIPHAIGIVMIPHFQEKFGERESRDDLRSYVMKFATGLSLVMPLVIGVGVILLQPLINFLLPKYAPGISAAQILLLGTFFMALAHPFAITIVTLKKHLFVLPLTFFTLFVAGMLDYLAIRLGYGLVGVASATFFTMLINFILTSSLLMWFMTRCQSYWIMIVGLLVPFMYSVMVLWVIFVVLTKFFVELHFMIQLMLFMIANAPLLWQLHTKFKLFNVILRKDS